MIEFASLPSANHEFKNGNNCGCIKHTIVTNDLTDIQDKKAKTAEIKEKKAVTPKKKGIQIPLSW